MDILHTTYPLFVSPPGMSPCIFVLMLTRTISNDLLQPLLHKGPEILEEFFLSSNTPKSKRGSIKEKNVIRDYLTHFFKLTTF